MKKGQEVISGLLFFFMAIVCIALFMPAVKEVISNNVDHLGNATSGSFLQLIITFFPMFLVVMLLVILIIIMRR